VVELCAADPVSLAMHVAMHRKAVNTSSTESSAMPFRNPSATASIYHDSRPEQKT
jgi:hypothetical protein